MDDVKTRFDYDENMPNFIGDMQENGSSIEYVNTEFHLNENMPDFYYRNTLNFNNENNENIAHINNEIVQNKYKPILVCVIIPTYNEARNIPQLLNSVYSEQQRIKYDEENIILDVLVVDDNSPDGTADVVKVYQKDNPNIHLLSRTEKNGLGAAYIAGMQHAMKQLKPGIIFEMDGDLSHGPEYILPMINKVREGADFVIGSRYVKGGSIPENWGMTRKLISKSANIYAKTVLGIKDVNDCTGGFRAIRTSALEKIDFDSLKTKGYAFQISLLEEMRRNNVIMKEVPISFKDRTNGTSKMRMYDILEEGLFVLKASLGNIFSPKKIALNNNQERESWILNNDTEQQTGLIQSNMLRGDQLEFIQSFGLEENPIELNTVY